MHRYINSCKRPGLFKIVFAAAISISLLLAPTFVRAESYLVHTGPNGYPPFLFVDERADGVRYSGIIVDLLDSFESMNPEFERRYNSMSRTRANLQIQRGKFSDLMFFSEEFAEPSTLDSYQFTHTLFESKDVVVTRQGDTYTYRKPEDLHGKSVAVIRGYTYWEFDELFEEGFISPFRVDRHVQAIGMLAKGRVDAYFGNMHVTPYYMKEIGLSTEEFNFSQVPLSEISYAFMIHREKKKLFDALNTFIKNATSDGTLQRILDQYIK